jgi:signal transduction histidine kinase
VNSFQWIFLLLLVLVIVSAGLISKYILAPFKRTMRVIQSFDLKQKDAIRLPETRTSEFSELNRFLKKMTEKAQEDYQSLKEFTENASHELQTPTAIIRGKLDLLMESDIRDEQAVLIAEMQNALERLSRIHSSLTLLTKLENEEYDVSEAVNMSWLVRAVLDSFEELMEMKSLQLRAEIEENVHVSLHPALADLLLMNLVGNAIRHNTAPGATGGGGAAGWIVVWLTREGLVISNSGRAPQVPVAELFERFKKGNPGGDSIGIGLAIVRQICDLAHFTVEYEYHHGVHTIGVGFTESVPASRLLQNLALPLQHVKTGTDRT